MFPALLSALLVSLPSLADEGCGLTPEVVPDFSLEDVNPNSPTLGQTLTRDDLLGEVLVIYWASAT